MSFDPNSRKSDFDSDDFSVDFDEDDFDEDDFETDKTDFTEESIQKQKSIPRDPNTNQSNDNRKKVIIGASVVLGIVVLLGGYSLIKNRNAKRAAEEAAIAQQQQQQQQTNNNDSTVNSEAKAGAPNLNADTTKSSKSVVEDGSKIVQDLQGKQVNANFTISTTTTVRDYVNYTKHRSVYPNGVEVYWLDTSYKNTESFPTQVPFDVYKELDDTGITVCDIEVVTTTDRQEIVTYMSVVKDSKSLINKESKKR